eukprot:s1104_g45.t1
MRCEENSCTRQAPAVEKYLVEFCAPFFARQIPQHFAEYVLCLSLSPEPVGMYCPSLKGTLELRHFRNDIFKSCKFCAETGSCRIQPFALLLFCSPARILLLRCAHSDKSKQSLSCMRPLIRTFQLVGAQMYLHDCNLAKFVSHSEGELGMRFQQSSL